MTLRERAEKWAEKNKSAARRTKDIEYTLMRAYMAGSEAAMQKLRYCCTCQLHDTCENGRQYPYGICADWKILRS